jgi:hypothetical protein
MRFLFEYVVKKVENVHGTSTCRADNKDTPARLRDAKVRGVENAHGNAVTGLTSAVSESLDKRTSVTLILAGKKTRYVFEDEKGGSYDRNCVRHLPEQVTLVVLP